MAAAMSELCVLRNQLGKGVTGFDLSFVLLFSGILTAGRDK